MSMHFYFKMIIMFIFYALFCVKQEMNIPAESQHTALVCPLFPSRNDKCHKEIQ